MIVEYASASWSGVAWRSPWPTARLTLSPVVHGRSMPPHLYSASVVPCGTFAFFVHLMYSS